ncbi:ATP-dependent nuclease [Methanobacterium formicicum]|uniref:ATP-dependent nuclease n=1 Tax=Methanobacterium formicicum TaxID=2162 RepID=UPI0024121B05|nr:AAA family ATPase [Methanobacterium formicicum]MDG3548594.1 AAA family ATPase [Methanobacterium formicicum]
MYLEKFIIKNFRAIEELELNFNKGLNILIGENNSGKTAVIDAMRLCLGYYQKPRDIYCSPSDFRINKSEVSEELEKIEFDLFFKCDNENDALFTDLLYLDDEGSYGLQLHFKHRLVDSKTSKRVKTRIWGGAKEGGRVDPDILSELSNVYLGALRDPKKNLKPNRYNILGNLYSSIILDKDVNKDREKKEELLKKVKELFNGGDWKDFINMGNERVIEHLEYLSYLTTQKKQDVKIDFVPFEFEKLLQNLIIQLPIYDDDLLDEDNNQRYFEIWQNGLGLNNLIYTAAVLGDIKQKKKKSGERYTLLLIEEPEAHLHPQLQSTFFNYLKELNSKHEFQIIVTSHSPTIAAKTDLNLLTILQNNQNKICSTQINDIGLDKNNLEFLQKFLDVTKSQLFFANGVLLVEGISEALLIPIFSKMLGEEYNIERNGIEVVNVNGVSFKHFAKLFFSDDEKKRLNCRCGIITDDDEGKKQEGRVQSICELENNYLKPFFARKTFEYELFLANNDNPSLLKVFSEIHPEIFKRISKEDDIEKKADIFVNALSKNKTKSDFSFKLSIELEKDNNYKNFNVPCYIGKSIRFVVEGTEFEFE